MLDVHVTSDQHGSDVRYNGSANGFEGPVDGWVDEFKFIDLGSMHHKLRAHPRIDLGDLSTEESGQIPITFLHQANCTAAQKVLTQEDEEDGVETQERNANKPIVFREYDQPRPKTTDPRCSDMTRFAWVLILGCKWGDGDKGRLRRSVPCAMFLYAGHFELKHFAANIKRMGKGKPVVLQGASVGCYGWTGWTHELLRLKLPKEPFGYGCFWCKDPAVVSQDLMRCANCKFCKYCSKGCQQQHWRTHKHECQEIASAFEASNRRQYRQTFFGPMRKEESYRWRSILDDVAVNRDPSLPVMMQILM